MRNQAQEFDLFACLQKIQENYVSSSEEKNAPQQFESSISTSKRLSFKNKYVNKLKQSIGRQPTTRRPLMVEEIQQSNDFQNSKKVKNKIAAKESRDRKKMYINIVEHQTKALEDQLNHLNSQIENCKAEISRLTFASTQNVPGTDHTKISHIINKLKKLKSEEESEERNNQINLTIDSLCYRFAAAGKERKRNIEECYRQGVNLSFTTNQRYLMWSAQNSCHFFRKESQPPCPEKETWFQEMTSLLKEVKLHQQIQQSQQDIVESRNQISSLLGKLNKTKKKIGLVCEDLDEVLQDVRSIFSPVQMAQFLIFEQTCRYRQDLRFHESILSDQNKEVQHLGIPKKQVKNQNS